MALTKLGNIVNQSPAGRNLLINGDFNIWQRGTSLGIMSSSPKYTADRWACERGGSGSNSVSANSTSPDNYRTSLLFTSDDATSKNLYAWQRIEGDNFRPIIGETVFVGAWVRMSISDDVHIQVMSNPGSRDVWASNENNDKTAVKYSSFSVTADEWTFISTTFVVTSECANGVAVGFRFGQIDAVANCYITGARAYQGFEKLPWSMLSRSYGEELALCQRYFEKSYNENIPPGNVDTKGMEWQYDTLGGGATHTTGGCSVKFRVEKRASPTVVAYSDLTGTSGKGHDWTNGVDVNVSVASPGTAGFYWYGSMTASAGKSFSTHWAADAEL